MLTEDKNNSASFELELAKIVKNAYIMKKKLLSLQPQILNTGQNKASGKKG